ncbi:hypothetical protein HYS31_00505 [Candidatus Woesearchaeota archaeon]|nr:hypothetical protein [Candidatus Woesearchaeota archaeon]
MAQITSETMTRWVILGLFMLFFFFAVFANNTGLWQKMGKSAFGIIDRFYPSKPSPNVKQDESLSPNAVNAQKDFMNVVYSSREQGNCILNLKSLSGLEDLSLELSGYNGVSSSILKPEGKEGGLRLEHIEAKDNKLQLCVVEPKAFYSCYLSVKNCNKQTYKLVNSIQLTKNRILIDKKDEQSYALSQVLFKPDKDKVCFIPVHESNSRWGCDATNKTIDDDCVNDIVNNKIITPCSDLEKADITKAKTEFTSFADFLNSLQLKQYTNICKKVFIFRVSYITPGLYILFSSTGKIELKSDKNNVGIIESRDINGANSMAYVPSLKSESEVNFAFYKSSDFVVSPSGYEVFAESTINSHNEPDFIAVQKDNKWLLTNPTEYTKNLPIC